MREQIVSQGVKMSRHAILQCTHANHCKLMPFITEIVVTEQLGKNKTFPLKALISLSLVHIK